MAVPAPGGVWPELVVARRELRPDDVAVRVLWCGVCHSDLHAVEAMTAGAPPLVRAGAPPLVPGHEFVGEVAEVGDAVTGLRPGDLVGVGNIVDSCGECAACRDDQEQFCAGFPTLTYDSASPGAYAGEYVVRESFAYLLPDGLDPARAAPLMCAGATVFEPLRRWNAGPGQLVGVVGLGGLGHLAVKFAKALGARVAVFTTSPGKVAAARELGADEVILSADVDAQAGRFDLSTDVDARAGRFDLSADVDARAGRFDLSADVDARAGRFDLILDTAPAKHDPSPYLRALRMDGTLCMLGIPDRYDVDAMALLHGYKRLTASGSAGRRRTREMLSFAAAHGITADVEKIPARQVGEAFARLARNDVRWRFVLDLTDLG